MITEQRKMILKTTENEDVEVDINFSSNPLVSEGKVLRFTFGDKTFSVKRDDLTMLLLAVGDQDTQKKLLPLKLSNVKRLERMLFMEFPASKDYKKGELIALRAPWIDEVPSEEEIMSGNFNRVVKKLKK